MAPATGTVTLTVTIVVWPAPNVVKLHVITPPEPNGGVVKQLLEGVTLENHRLGGKVTVKTTEVASLLPLFLICQIRLSAAG